MVVSLKFRQHRAPALHKTADGVTSPEIELFEEIISLVVDDDEGGEVLHFDPPDRLHAELGVLDRLDFLDAVLREIGRRASDGSKIEAAMLAAGFAHRSRAVAL